MSNELEQKTHADMMDRRTMFIAMLHNDMETLEREIVLIKAKAFDRISADPSVVLSASKLAYEEINSLCADFVYELKESLQNFKFTE